jgi:hypothetical protein
VKVTTNSGAVYEIRDGICYKTDHRGFAYEPFKVWVTKPVEYTYDLEWDQFWALIHSLPEGEPEIGKHLYIAGKDNWWISTTVVSIEE